MENFSALCQKEIYIRQLKRLVDKQPSQQQLFKIHENDVELFYFIQDSEIICHAIANEIQQQRYQFKPVRPNTMYQNGKERTVFSHTISDRLVQMALLQQLLPTLKLYLNHFIYSYLPNRNRLHAIANFHDYIKRHTQNNKTDLFVIRTDISAYTDSIPVHQGAALWDLLAKFFADPLLKNFPPYLQELIAKALRPLIIDGKQHYQFNKGLPMGSPITILAALLYLDSVDRELASFPDVFYARFGDDLLIAHPNSETILAIEQQLYTLIASLELKCNPEKTIKTYLTRCGRPYKDSTFTHQHFIEYLGFRIFTDGSHTLKQEKLNAIKTRIAWHVDNLIYMAKQDGLDLENQADILCKALSNGMHPQHLLFDISMIDLYSLTTNNNSLKELDNWLREYVANQLLPTETKNNWVALNKRIQNFGRNMPSFQYCKNQFWRKRAIKTSNKH